MSFARQIQLKGNTLSDTEPVVCVPLVGVDDAALAAELAVVVPKSPGMIEWRVDFFAEIADVQRVLSAAAMIRPLANGIPLLFTRRSVREGGNPISLDEDQVLAMIAEVARSGNVDLVDCELSVGTARFEQAVALAKETGVRLVASFHDFQQTPAAEELLAKFSAMQAAGADIAKIAVMPRNLRDVLTLLEATLNARETLTIPIISMSMGEYGSLSRFFGWVFGSSVSFAKGEKSSAPGQVPIEDLNLVVEVLNRALGKPRG